ncbi:hypothetical protein MY5147_007869 [Beauveria neobassiana]
MKNRKSRQKGPKSAGSPPPQARAKVPRQGSEGSSSSSSSSGASKVFSSGSSRSSEGSGKQPPNFSEDSEVLSPIDEDTVAVSFDTSPTAKTVSQGITELSSIEAAFHQLTLEPGDNEQQL